MQAGVGETGYRGSPSACVCVPSGYNGSLLSRQNTSSVLFLNGTIGKQRLRSLKSASHTNDVCRLHLCLCNVLPDENRRCQKAISFKRTFLW